ncbi:MAG: hypothetical protein DSY77_03445 [Bacteroidetes bacterium]|nr:MAG: hypothetical protein DSY77_03445 [Bacteroidota bacterium]
MSFFGCQEEDLKQDSTIYGTWQLVEIYDGGSPKPNQSVKNGYQLTITSSGTAITTNQTIGCSSTYEQLNGSFSLEQIDDKEAIVFEFYCPELDNNIEDVEFYLEFNDDLLVLTPTNRVNTCFEGCEYEFKKIADEIKQTD